MQSNLVGNAVPGVGLHGNYWSSTEVSGNPQGGAWDQVFASGGSGVQGFDVKGDQLGVRCVRALTP